MSERQTFLKNKPYEFLPLLETCERFGYGDPPVREDCVYSGKLGLKITVLSPLHIGGGLQDYDADGNVIKKQMRRNGQVILPGSSLKGAVRSVAEAVSYSCAVKLPGKVLDLQRALPAGNKQPCQSAGRLCMACYIFGMMAGGGGNKKKDGKQKDGKQRDKSDEPTCFRGRAQFGEFVLESGSLIDKNLPALKSPFQDYPNPHDIFPPSKKGKISYGNERLYYCKACTEGNCESCTKENYFQKRDIAGQEREMEFRGRKFYSTGKEWKPESGGNTRYEMIAPKSVLKGEVVFENLRQEEGRLLAYALDIGHSFCMKLGYGKPLGYGKVKIDLERVQSLGDRYPSAAKVDKELVERWAREYRTQHTGQIKMAVDELERIMSVDEMKTAVHVPEMDMGMGKMKTAANVLERNMGNGKRSNSANSY